MRGKRGALVQALPGRFDAHHAELARMLLDHYDALTAQIDRLTVRIQELIGAIPAAQAPSEGAGPTGSGDGGTTGTSANPPPAQPPLGALDRLDEVPGIGAKAAQVIIAELGLDMGQFPTPGSWCRGPGCHRAPSSPAPNAAPAPPARATPTSRACSARSPPRPPRPTPSSASATAAWSG